MISTGLLHFITCNNKGPKKELYTHTFVGSPNGVSSQLLISEYNPIKINS